MTNNDWALVAERFIRISSKTSSRSRLEIRPDRRTSSSSRFRDLSRPWLELAAVEANPLEQSKVFNLFHSPFSTHDAPACMGIHCCNPSLSLRNEVLPAAKAGAVTTAFHSRKTATYLTELPHKHCECCRRLPSVSRTVLNTMFRAKPAKYRTNLLDRKIEAMFCVTQRKTRGRFFSTV